MRCGGCWSRVSCVECRAEVWREREEGCVGPLCGVLEKRAEVERGLGHTPADRRRAPHFTSFLSSRDVGETSETATRVPFILSAKVDSVRAFGAKQSRDHRSAELPGRPERRPCVFQLRGPCMLCCRPCCGAASLGEGEDERSTADGEEGEEIDAKTAPRGTTEKVTLSLPRRHRLTTTLTAVNHRDLSLLRLGALGGERGLN